MLKQPIVESCNGYIIINICHAGAVVLCDETMDVSEGETNVSDLQYEYLPFEKLTSE
jgi:hypothetical protein